MNEFLRCVLESNPFAQSVVGEAADAAVHVEAVHQGQFQELTASVEDVRRTGGNRGRVVWGEAGVGKSHLLARLERWARREGSAFCPIVRNLDAHAGSKPWTIVKSVLRQMTRDYCANCPLVSASACSLVQICSCRSSETGLEGASRAARPAHGGLAPAPWRQMPLYRLVRGAVERALAELPERPAPYRAGQVLDVFHRLVDHQLRRLNGAQAETGAICELLFRFFLAAQRNQEHPGADRAAISAVKCLSGDPLESSQASRLGVHSPVLEQHSVSLSRVVTAQTVVLALAELARLSDRALVLCFDQVDGLTAEQAGSLTRFLGPLVDQARNLMVVFSGQQQAILDLVDRGAIDQATWQHLNPDRREILLSRIPIDQARQVVQARLRRFVEPFLTLPKVRHRVEQDPLFPLESDWFAGRVASYSSLPVREALDLARDRWREQQARLADLGGQAWLAEKREGRGERGEGRRPDAVSACLGLSLDADHRPPSGTQTSGPAAKNRRETGERRKELPGGGQFPFGPLPSPLSPLPSRSDSRRMSRFKEIAGWSTSAVLLVAIGVVFWARTSGFMDADKPHQVAARWDTQSAGLRHASPGHGKAALPLSDPTTASATATPQSRDAFLAEKSPPAIKEDRASGDAFPVDHDALLAAPPPASPPVLVARIDVPPAPAAARAAPRGVARVPPVEGGPAPVVPPAPLAPRARSGPVDRPFAATPAADEPRNAENVAADPADQDQPVSSATARRRAFRVGQTTDSASSRAETSNSRALPPPGKPVAVKASPEVERMLDDAWGLIERGDLGPGRTRLLAARKADQGDLRADFSLGLLDALTSHDWDSAGRHFTECLRRERENIPTLNNLAIVLVQNKREGEAAKHWKAIVSQQAAVAEVVQNVGVVRHLMDEGMIRKNNSLSKALERLYTEAAVATSTTWRPQAGFRFMALALADGRSVGFSNPKKMQLAAWSPAPTGLEPKRPPGKEPAPRTPVTSSAGDTASQGRMAGSERSDGRGDLRAGPGRPLVPEDVRPGGASPAAVGARASLAVHVFPNPAANFPLVPRPGYRDPRR